VTIQAQILDLLADLKDRQRMSLLFITHDLTIVRKIADRVCVMKNGEIVETGPTAEIFANPQHPYTQMLLAAESSGVPAPVPDDAPVVAETNGAKIWFPIQRGLLKRTVGHVKAVNDATLQVRAGETVGIVGESGSGKTTLALAIMRLQRSEGQIIFQGKEISALNQRQMRPDNREMVAEIMGEVGLDPALMDRYPHEFSGGQRQRIAIARAMILRPKLFISHDLKVVRALSHKVMVMKQGDVVEHGDADAIFDAPQTDYTRALMAAAFEGRAI